MSKHSTPSQVYEVDNNIVLRTAEVGDAQLISQYFTVNRDFLKPWEPERDEAFYSYVGWHQRLVKLSELHRLGIGFYLLITDKNTQAMYGTISFSNLVRFPMHSCTVGYSLAESAQGKGIMSRALKMACHYMFDMQNMHRISACYMPHNQRSAAVLNKAGFVEEGFAKDYLLINGQWQDHKMMSLTNLHWQG